MLIINGLDDITKDNFFMEIDGDTYYCIKKDKCIDAKNITEDIRQMNDDNFKEHVNDNFKHYISKQNGKLLIPPPYIFMDLERLKALPPNDKEKIFRKLNISGRDKIRQFVELQKLYK